MEHYFEGRTYLTLKQWSSPAAGFM